MRDALGDAPDWVHTWQPEIFTPNFHNAAASLCTAFSGLTVDIDFVMLKFLHRTEKGWDEEMHWVARTGDDVFDEAACCTAVTVHDLHAGKEGEMSDDEKNTFTLEISNEE